MQIKGYHFEKKKSLDKEPRSILLISKKKKKRLYIHTSYKNCCLFF